MNFELTILGSNSALPTSNRFSSCQILNVREKLFMIDCGEGAQIQMRKYKLRFSRLNAIFISHLHGDHVFGLPGLLSSLSLLGRSNALAIYAHQDLEKVLTPVLNFFAKDLGFELQFHAIDPAKNIKIFEDRTIEVFTVPLSHRIATCGFLFREKAREIKIKKDAIIEYGITIPEIISIKEGSDLHLADGRTILHDDLVIKGVQPRSYAYISDTAFKPDIAPIIDGVDLLYHEATFANEEELRASKTFHSTVSQAAKIAQLANAKKLLIGHFSARYKNVDQLEAIAREIFPNTVAVDDGMTFEI